MPGQPVTDITADRLDHQFADTADHAVALGQGDESFGGDGAALVIDPASKRLEAGQVSTGKLDNGLIAGPDVMGTDGARQGPVLGIALPPDVRADEKKTGAQSGSEAAHHPMLGIHADRRMATQPDTDTQSAEVAAPNATGHLITGFEAFRAGQQRKMVPVPLNGIIDCQFDMGLFDSGHQIADLA